MKKKKNSKIKNRRQLIIANIKIMKKAKGIWN